MSRRPTKSSTASRSNAATAFSTGYERPPTSSHLDLTSANDDDTMEAASANAFYWANIVHDIFVFSGSNKIHKKSKQQLRRKGTSILLATACCVISLCTIYYAATKFSYMTKHHVNSSLSIHHEKKVAAENESNNHHHHTNLHLPPDSIYRTELTDIHNKPQSLLQYAGSISLIVNVACE